MHIAKPKQRAHKFLDGKACEFDIKHVYVLDTPLDIKKLYLSRKTYQKFFEMKIDVNNNNSQPCI